MAFSDILAGIGKFLLGKAKMSEIATNRLIGRGQTRPHPWSTRFDDYVCWSGLTDRSYFARLLPAIPSKPNLPDPAALWPLFAAKQGQQVECSKSTCLFPAFAQYLTDGFLRTRQFNSPPGPGGRPQPEERKRTTSNHEIDLSTLYGRTEDQTNALRSKNGGKLLSQTINGEEFPLFLYDANGQPNPQFMGPDGFLMIDEPLGLNNATVAGRSTLFAVGGDRVNSSIHVCAINTLFLREHNRVAGELAKKHPTWNDERLFQIARNILIVMFIQIVVLEYVNHISSAPFRFLVDPTMVWKADWNRPNWMTLEFTLLYRWHSLVPETIKWGGQTITAPAMLLNNDLLLKSGLAGAFAELSANKAARMALGNFAGFFDKAEQEGIKQGRLNNLQGYNAYRKVMGFPPAKSFTDVVGKSKDATEQARRTALAAQLQQLYGDVENLDFYVGLFAEPCEPNSPLPELALAMVAMDAFSQALPNPLLSEHIWGDEAVKELTFTEEGIDLLKNTNCLRDVLARVTPNLGDSFVGMTRPDWKRS